MGTHTWIYIANKCTKFYAKRLSPSKNIDETRRGSTFFYSPCIYLLQERQKVQDLEQQLELETGRLRREHERDIEALTHELKTARHQLDQQLQRRVIQFYTICIPLLHV